MSPGTQEFIAFRSVSHYPFLLESVNVAGRQQAIFGQTLALRLRHLRRKHGEWRKDQYQEEDNAASPIRLVCPQ